MDDFGLRERVREAIRAGSFPDRDADRTWGGPGSGMDCAVCGHTLHPIESELELEFLPDAAEQAPTVLHLHGKCFLAWQAERLRKAAPTNGKALPLASDGGTIRDRERTPSNDQERP
jgi:hypothetical protein